MKDNNIISWIGSGITVVCGGLSTNEVAQLVLYILGIVSAIVSLGYNLWKWYKKSSADGKIDKSEIQEGVKIISDGVNDISEKANKENKDGKL